jgi:mono/diheme cytochrome c family protein
MKLLSSFLLTLLAVYLSVSILAQPMTSRQSPAVRNGQRLYAQSCTSCHDAHSTIRKAGPGMMGYFNTRHPRPTDSSVRAIIAKGKGTMPGFSNFTDMQMNELITYLKTL